jgi:class 3 adenylate cyclase/tetratricopeptide (TPR) repeat protein
VPIACPSCGTESPDGFKFCGQCAAPLAAPPSISEERKVVTTLFCDLVAFTAMSEAADPEDIDRILGEYFARATKVIESHGGAIEKFIGDAVVGVFGVPAAHEDDPERAVRAGLRILGALEGMTRPDGTPLQARIGVNTGEALVRLDVDPASGRGFLTGDAVNTAARLQAAAPPMAVLVGALTRDLSHGAIEYERLSAVPAKGKAEPVPAWIARRPLARTGLRTAGFTTTPFLGRDREISALHDMLRESAGANQSQMALLVAEPGVGKSRLVLEFARSLDERPEMVTWRQGRCLPYGEGVTFWPLGEILREHAGILDSDDVGTVEAKLEAVLPDGEDAPWLRQRLRPLVGLDASQADREENFAAWERLFRLITDGRPAVVVLEDLHWAGEAMLAFVEYLLSRDLEAPLLIICTTRPELLQQHEGPLTTDSADSRLRRITLPTLSVRQTGALVAALLDAEPSVDSRARIVDTAGGNPLYAEQYVRLLLDRDLVVQGSDGLRLVQDADLSLPATVHAVLAARLDTLTPEHKALLCDAAVLGETFWRGAVAALSGREESTVDEAMQALLARDFVRAVVVSTLEGEPEYLFWHALARDVAYGQLPRGVRARKHQAAARWIGARATEHSNEFAAIVAHHYTMALDLARAVGDEQLAAQLLVPAIDALGQAGDLALRLDVAAAERHFARALELAGQDAGARVKLLPRWAKALYFRNRYREAACAYEEAVAGLKASGQLRAAALALCWQCDALTYLGEPAAHLKQAAVDLLVDDGPSPELAEILGHYALSLAIQDDDPSSVMTAADRAIEMCRLLTLPEPVVALSTRGLARLTLGDIAGLGDCERAEAAARTQGLGIERSTILLNHSSAILTVKGAAAERAALNDGLEFASRHGLGVNVVAYRASLVGSLLTVGEWDEALSQAADLLPELEALEDVWDLLGLRSFQARVLVARGEAAAAVPFLSWLTENGRDSEMGWTRAYALLGASAVHLALGEEKAALTLLTECIAKPRAVVSIVDALPEVVRTALGCGAVELAAEIGQGVESLLPASRLPLHEHVIATYRALLLEKRGEPQAAAEAFAAARWHDFGVPYEEAQALLGQGRCMVALGRAQEAAEPLEQAHEIFERLGAKPALEETEDWLGKAH